MDASAPRFLCSLLLSIHIVCFTATGALLSPVKDTKQQQLQREEQIFLHSTRKEQVPRTIQHDFFPTTTPVTTPVTVTVPPATSSPAIVTIPAATPVTVTPTPASTPVTVSPTTPTTNPNNSPVPVTNPVTTPSTNTPGGQPVTNPVTSPTPTGTTPAVAPPAATNAPAVPGQSWCVAKTGAPEKSLQAAIDYACGIGKADCSAIQQGASCYNPNTLQNHASYAFNSYYQRNPVPTSCDFGGTAVITSSNPSSGSCVFTTSSSSTSPTTGSPTTTTPTPTPTTPSSPTTASPITTTPTPNPTTASSAGAAPMGSSGTPPNILNASNPTLGGATTGFGDSPPTVNTSDSRSSSLQPFIGSIIVVTSIITGAVVLDI